MQSLEAKVGRTRTKVQTLGRLGQYADGGACTFAVHLHLRDRTSDPLRLILALISCTALAAAVPCAAQAEPDVRRNSVYYESLGNGGLFSFNYERLLSDRLALRLGFASWEASDFLGYYGGGRVTTVPIMLNSLHGGSGRRWFELGAGVLVGSNGSAGFQTLTGTVGMRWHVRRAWLIRTGITPFYGLNDESSSYPDKGFFTTAGFSFGYRF